MKRTLAKPPAQATLRAIRLTRRGVLHARSRHKSRGVGATRSVAAADRGPLNESPTRLIGMALHGLRRDQLSAMIALRKTPMPPSISTSTTSPGFSHKGGLRAKPTPSGVPVEITSPAANGVQSEQ